MIKHFTHFDLFCIDFHRRHFYTLYRNVVIYLRLQQWSVVKNKNIFFLFDCIESVQHFIIIIFIKF